ncbi:MAG TPA: iron ABC transporter permease, partial [Firmicutes bacterium]|nr:iron ABC transporter permease [Bacillota bacterium]
MSRVITLILNQRSVCQEEAKQTRLFVVLSIYTILIFLVSLSVGKYHVPPLETLKILLSTVLPVHQSWSDQMQNVVLNMRLPRLCVGLLTGAALSLSGATYQGMFRNPLVSPDLLGVSAGACVGAALAIILHFNSLGVQLMALIFGLAAVLFTTTIPRLLKNDSSLMLVLAGVIVGGFMSSLLGIFKYVADPEMELASIVYWTMGSFASIKAQAIVWVAPPMILSAAVLLLIRWRINLLSLGDKEARSLGLNVRRVRGLAIVCATILTACAVCISG